MNKLKNWLYDGANYQAKGVLCYMQCYDGIEESWNKEHRSYDAMIKLGRWENCREQGYVVSLLNEKHIQLNIAWFEHRNSDAICAIKWFQNSINSLTIDTAEFEGVYKDKWDVSFKVNYGEVVKMADWIWDQLIDHWVNGQSD